MNSNSEYQLSAGAIAYAEELRQRYGKGVAERYIRIMKTPQPSLVGYQDRSKSEAENQTILNILSRGGAMTKTDLVRLSHYSGRRVENILRRLALSGQILCRSAPHNRRSRVYEIVQEPDGA
jgi:hypothetical protein